jgi:hypothetical protein
MRSRRADITGCRVGVARPALGTSGDEKSHQKGSQRVVDRRMQDVPSLNMNPFGSGVSPTGAYCVANPILIKFTVKECRRSWHGRLKCSSNKGMGNSCFPPPARTTRSPVSAAGSGPAGADTPEP